MNPWHCTSPVSRINALFYARPGRLSNAIKTYQNTFLLVAMCTASSCQVLISVHPALLFAIVSGKGRTKENVLQRSVGCIASRVTRASSQVLKLMEEGPANQERLNLVPRVWQANLARLYFLR